MKFKLIKLIFVLIIISMIASIVVACSGGDDNTNQPPGNPNDNTNTTVNKLEINYSDMAIVGSSFKSFGNLFDEQAESDPTNSSAKVPETKIAIFDSNLDGDITQADKDHLFDFTIDLGSDHMISYIYVYYPSAEGKIIFETGTPFSYEGKFTLDSPSLGWNKVTINKETRYLNILYLNSASPCEILVYGYKTKNAEPVNTEPHQNKTMGYLLGINGNKNDSNMIERVRCSNYFRDYINWCWFYELGRYPRPGTTFMGSFGQDYDGLYTSMTQSNIDAVPCFMFGEEATLEGADKSLPESYVMYGELLYQFVVRYGNNPNNSQSNTVTRPGALNKKVNMNLIKWVEAGNEPNGEGNDGYTPYQMAALTSTAYDGHCGTVISGTGSGVGVKNADPNIKMAMAGLAGVGTNYIKAMAFWMKYNRPDGKLAMEAFNVHTYCRKTEQYNGYTISYGVCPEVGGITDYVVGLTEFRDKYYPNTEVWLTEFGWDTNESYETENACHSYGEYSARELQAMWLIRAYFMFAKAGVDRCAMYMCSDLGNEATSVGKYGTSGIVASNGEYKDSYYYIYTVKNTMNDMYFAEEIDSGNEDVWIYRFENGNGKSCYALWCPTMDSVAVNDYTLKIDGASATLTEFANGETSGISSELTVTNGTVSVDVTECPILIFSE